MMSRLEAHRPAELCPVGLTPEADLSQYLLKHS